MFGLSASQDDNLPLMPALPVLGKGISLFKPNNSGSILDNEYVHAVSSGGAAIYFALKSHQVQAGDEVLIPAYHCPAMVEPVIELGAVPVFFSITESIKIDIDDIASKISNNTKAILIPHFFGVHQDIAKLKQICNLPKTISIIEDCAHAFFMSPVKGEHSGDYIIGSLTKFFPTHDGGVLISRNKLLEGLRPLSFKQELKAIYNVLHDAVRFGRLKTIAWIFSVISWFKSSPSVDYDAESSRPEHEPEKTNKRYLDEISLSASKACKYIIAHADFKSIIQKRQQNYHYIINELAGEDDIDLSLNQLRQGFIPYMVIGRLLNPQKHHPLLISKKLPIWRWENIYPSDCEISKQYSQSIIQIPCHQQLSGHELVNMVATIKICLQED